MKSLAIAFSLCLLMIGSVSAQLVNPGFEQWEGGNPVGWFTWNIPGFILVVESSDQAFAGSHACKMMINQTLNGNYIEQTFAVTSLEASVSVGLHYTGIPDSTEGEITILGSRGGQFQDGNSESFVGQSPNYQAVSLVWEPRFNDLDSVTVMILFSAINGDSMFDASVLIDEVTITGVNGQGISNDDTELPQAHSLVQVYPNPFNGNATIHYSTQNGPMTLSIFDNQGRKLGNLLQGMSPASGNLTWNGMIGGANLPTGRYFIVLNAGGKTISAPAVLLR
jgi:hypothetical protein